MKRSHFLAVSFTTLIGCVAAFAAHRPVDQAKNVSTMSTTNGRLPVRLEWQPNYGCSVSTDFKPGAQPIQGRLISIDGQNLRGKSERQINELLKGKVGSSSKITYLDSNGEEQTIELQRESLHKAGSPALTDLSNEFASIDDWIGSIGERPESEEDQNLDLFARATLRRSVEAANELPGDNSPVVEEKALASIRFADMVGDVHGADDFAALALAQASKESNLNTLSPKTFEDALADLTPTDRLSTYEALDRRWLALIEKASKKSTPVDPRQTHPVNEMLEKVLEYENKKEEALQLAKSIEPISAQAAFTYGPEMDSKNIANAFDRLGDINEAAQVYELGLSSIDTQLRSGQRPPFNQVWRKAFIAYRLAQLREKQNNLDEAIAKLQYALTYYDSHVQPDQLLLCEKYCGFFPAPSDLEVYLAKLKLKQKNLDAASDFAKSAIHRIESGADRNCPTLRNPLQILVASLNASNHKSEASEAAKRLASLPLPQEDSPSDLEKVAIFRDTYRAIDAKQSNQSITKLLAIYDEEEPDRAYKRRPLNMFCGLLNLSRLLADHGRTGESDALLSRLTQIAESKEFTPAAYYFIKVEEALNSEKRKASERNWIEIGSSFPGALYAVPCDNSSDLPEATKVSNALKIEEAARSLAVLYEAAGEQDRANLLIDRALAERKQVEETPNAKLIADEFALARAKVILLLDAARLHAEAGRVSEARNLASDAVMLCASTLPDQGQQPEKFSFKYLTKIVELAKCYRRQSVSVEQIKSFLGLVSSKLTMGAMSSAQESRGIYYSVPTPRASFERCYAQLLLDDGHYVDAEDHIKKALEQKGSSTDIATNILGGDIASKNRQYDLAAERYMRSESTSVPLGLSTFYKHGSDQKYLSQAYVCAELAKNYDKMKLASICIKLAHFLEYEDPKRALAYFEQAQRLIPESDPGKLALIQTVLSVKSRLSATSIDAKDKAELEKSSLALSIEQAKRAEEQNNPRAAHYWLRVAELEASFDMAEKAQRDVEHAIKLYRPDSDASNFREDFLPSHYGVCGELVKHGHQAIAEALLLLAVHAIELQNGCYCAATADQLSHLAEFYFSQHRDQDAWKTLDEILAIDPRVIEVQIHSMQSALRNLTSISDSYRKNQPELALKISNAILEAQRKNLDPDDQRIAESLVRVAQLEYEMNRLEDAEKHFWEAARILKLHVGIMRLEQSTGGLYSLISKKREGKDPQKIDVPSIGWVCPDLLRKMGDSADADVIERTEKVPRGYVDAQFYNTGNKVYELIEMQKEYADARTQAPYSRRSAAFLRLLTKLASSTDNWQLLADASTDTCKIYERQPDTTAGRRYGCVPAETTRIESYLKAATAFSKLGKFAEASAWLERAVKVLPEPTSYEFLVLAEKALECGDHDLAIKYATLLDQRLTDEASMFDASRAAAIWNKLGRPEHAKELVAQGQRARRELDERTERMRSNVMNENRIWGN